MDGSSKFRDSQEPTITRGAHVSRQSMTIHDTTVPSTCLPHTSFAGVWTSTTHAKVNNHLAIHAHGSVPQRCCTATGGWWRRAGAVSGGARAAAGCGGVGLLAGHLGCAGAGDLSCSSWSARCCFKICWRPLSILIEKPAKVRGGCSRDSAGVLSLRLIKPAKTWRSGTRMVDMAY